MYRCLIVDDENLARELIETHLTQLDEFEIVASCKSALEAHKVIQKEAIDLMFLDIEMPVLKGTDFFKNLSQKPKVIFTTAYREYALDGFELNAVDYLVKPITFERFFKAIEKFLESSVPRTRPVTLEPPNFEPIESIFVQSNKKKIKVLLDDVNYIESLKDYVKIHLRESTVLVKHGLSNFHELLDGRFIRIHRSYIVNSSKVTAFTKQDVEINKIEIPIGDMYKKSVLDFLDGI